METLEALQSRKAVRKYKKEQIKDSELDTILAAGGIAPIGLGDHASIHITVIQNPDLLSKVSKAVKTAVPAMEVPDPIYGAPTLIIVSSAPNERMPTIGDFNAACILENMLVAAADLGVGSVFMLSTILAFSNASLSKDLQIPIGFKPMAAAAFGYADEPVSKKELKNPYETTILR
ncbi:hypothetical protein MmiEs2_00470 [Methanimicrococcus stummii]|uniref:Nitroreductase domain-containing protein n=1 Tax=Methanimicrococcus stummii TaxID=3028294 RepID=A0AA96V911_9EURY|nr:nitroreductase family protein [Methanimicrococcus sp. Es2]WNY27870.1 hypothetical protein MmiEs2_00470 [Methanimicrococcus sp. Es2]